MRAVSRAFSVVSIALFAAALIVSAPARAEVGFGVSVNDGRRAVSFSYFHDRLAGAGVWFHDRRWGEVWRPTLVEAGFHPYRHGHWAFTSEFGWTWVSAYDWDDSPFHYGRWVDDIDAGWIWVPGYVWSPAWVVWRTGGGVIGWGPMPPDEPFLEGSFAISDAWYDDDYFGYPAWYGASFGPLTFASLFVFVDSDHFVDRDFDGHVIEGRAAVPLISQTHTLVNATVENGRIVNHGIDPRTIERATGRPLQTVDARSVIRDPSHVADVRAGTRIAAQERGMHPTSMAAARALQHFKAEGARANPRHAMMEPQGTQSFGRHGTSERFATGREAPSARFAPTGRRHASAFSPRGMHEQAMGRRYSGREATGRAFSRREPTRFAPTLRGERMAPHGRFSREPGMRDLGYRPQHHAYNGPSERGFYSPRGMSERGYSRAMPEHGFARAPIERGAYAPRPGREPMMERGMERGMPMERGSFSPRGGREAGPREAPQRRDREPPHGG